LAEIGRKEMNEEYTIGSWVNLTSKEKPTRIAGRIVGIEESEMFGTKIKVEVIGWLYANEWLISVIKGHKNELSPRADG